MIYQKYIIAAAQSLIINLIFIPVSIAQLHSNNGTPPETGKYPLISWILPGGPPPPTPDLPPLSCNYDDCVDVNKNPIPALVIKDLSKAEKDHYWKNRTFDSNGVIILNFAADEALAVIESMFAHSAKKSSFIQIENQLSKKISTSVSVISALKEQMRRTNYFINVPTGIAMLTIWDIKADGGQITMPRDALNVKVRESDASLLFIKGGAGSKKRQWNLSWVEKDTYFELQIPDEIQPSGVAKLKKEDILDFAIKFTNP